MRLRPGPEAAVTVNLGKLLGQAGGSAPRSQLMQIPGAGSKP